MRMQAPIFERTQSQPGIMTVAQHETPIFVDLRCFAACRRQGLSPECRLRSEPLVGCLSPMKCNRVSVDSAK